MNRYDDNENMNNEEMENEAMENEVMEAMEDEEMADEFDTLPKVIVIEQPYTDRYPLSEALRRGTLFPILKMPYMIKK